MASSPLDAIDRGILFHLQDDAHQPLTNIADTLGVADNTVRNRIQKLEDEGIIKRYTIDIDYARADIQHHYQFHCTARVSERERLVGEVQTIPGVVGVTTVMTGRQNVIVEAVAPIKEEITRIAYELDSLGLTIEREHLLWADCRQPYSGFRLEENL